MEWTITMHTLGGDHEYTVPFECRQVVYYAHKKKWWRKNSKWVVTVCVVTGVWAGGLGIYGVTMDNGENVAMCHFDQLFTDREAAIEYCIKKNAHAKVKIYGG